MNRAYHRRPVPRIAVVLALLALLAGCRGGSDSLLGNVKASAPAPSPDVRSPQNRLNVDYTLAGPAQVSAFILGPNDQRWTVEDGVRRPVGGQYQLNLDGTVDGPGPNERRALADGDYTVQLVAQAGSATAEASVPMPIRGADTNAPSIDGLTLFPDHISPNFDAQDDITRITYRLSKAARITPFADRVLPDGTRKRAWTGDTRQLDSGEQWLQWDGLLNDQPVPDGNYEFGIRAQDAAGNVSEARGALTVSAGGIADAKVVSALIAPRQLIVGNNVCLDMVVRNTGQTVLRTQGPAPDYVYNSFDTYASIADHQYVEHAGFWRIGLDWAGSTDTTGAKYPWRWGFGHDLQPGEDVSIHACVRVENEQTRMVFFSALMQENVALHDAGAGMAQVQISH